MVSEKASLGGSLVHHFVNWLQVVDATCFFVYNYSIVTNTHDRTEQGLSLQN